MRRMNQRFLWVLRIGFLIIVLLYLYDRGVFGR